MFYNVTEVTDNQILERFSDCEIIKSKRGAQINASNSFDIETSSFYNESEKHACMYIWGVCLNGLCLYGRTWIEFIELCYRLNALLCLGSKLKLVIYVHNLSYEFQFIRKFFEWKKIFARKKRKPITAEADIGIEFRCSYFLSGYALKTVARNLHDVDIQKLDEDFDYELIRHSETLINEEELKYLENDILIVYYFILEEMERNGNISKIPLTQTGYVREYVRNNCYNRNNNKEYKKYKDLMQSLIIYPEEYPQLKRAFAGGLTHASAFYSMKTVKNVSSYDLASSYPSVIVNEKFPMSTGLVIPLKSKDEFYSFMKTHCCIFDIEFINIAPLLLHEHIISAHRAWRKERPIIDNGRIVSADSLGITVTEIDFQLIEQFYTWDDFHVDNFRVYEKEYLPKPFVDAALTLYSQKTTLKGIPESEIEYMHSKQLINSMFGMCVTDIIMNDVLYDNHEWSEVDNSKSIEQIEKYNTQSRRFLFYPWGIYITAYARRNLCSAIIEWGSDYIYSDTDSVKGINQANHTLYIEEYNKNILRKNELAMIHHGFETSRTYPKDIKGIERHLGIWDYEGTYSRFKTLGAKRYMTEKDGKQELTVSGIVKKDGMQYINSISDNPFDIFTNELVIPQGSSGKNTITYLDEPFSGTIKDYLGNEFEYEELSAAHLEPAGYTFDMSSEYLNFLSTFNEEN